MNKYAHKDGCEIQRDFITRRAILIDDEGFTIRSFPVEWTDDQIWYALEFANRAYATGVLFGKKQMAADIRRLLGCAGKEEGRGHAD